MKLYTRTGDTGETSLFDGTRVPKDHLRVTAYGEVDELNSVLGWCVCAAGEGVLTPRLQMLQRELFTLGAELATPPGSRLAGRVAPISGEHNLRLETWIDEATAQAQPLRHFILPGGAELAARLHIARTVCRRAERAVVALAHSSEVFPEIIIYLNRLSDLLFAWARLANQMAGVADVPWVAKP